MVYCISTNDILWIFYPPVTETLTMPARAGATILNFLFLLTFQAKWSKELLEAMSHVNLVGSAFVGVALTYVIISVFKVFLYKILFTIIIFNFLYNNYF